MATPQAESSGVTLRLQLMGGAIIGFFLVAVQITAQSLLDATPREPVFGTEGEEVLIECVARDIGNHTLLWRRVVPGQNLTEVLTAGSARVVDDPRFSVIHDKMQGTWVLRINPVRPADTGRYMCEVNTIPPTQVYRILSVAGHETTFNPFSIEHNYTDCCLESGVPHDCLGFCNLRSLVSGGNRATRECMDHISEVTHCLADGRNHMPCCMRQNIPEMCRSVCVGDYNLSTVLQHYTCIEYTTPTLACIAEGIETLPGQPQDLTIEVISSTELRVSWTYKPGVVPASYCLVNVTQQHSFDEFGYLKHPPSGESGGREVTGFNITPMTTSTTRTYNVSGNETVLLLRDLKPLVMYEVQAMAFNQQGSSLPTYSVRAITLSTEPQPQVPIILQPLPELPDIKGCCRQKNVEPEKCVDTFCDPVKADITSLSDIMICAPWANVTFACMAGGVDHSPCCQERGIPDVCLNLCRGNVSRLDYRYFECLRHMPSYSNCLLEHYAVLPGPPLDFSLGSIHSHWAVLRWKPPNVREHTVTGYMVHWRLIVPDGSEEYEVHPDVKSPFLLDNLIPGMQYETYVVAENKYGASRSSVRLLFSTPPAPMPLADPLPAARIGYNETSCCVSSHLKDFCMPICSYEMKLSDLHQLGVSCVDQVPTLIRCMTGGRDHVPCCRRRGVRPQCQAICAGVMDKHTIHLAILCGPELGSILQCMADGSETLPGVPEDVHSTFVSANSIHLKWSPPKGNTTVTGYQVQFGESQENVPLHPLEHVQTVTVPTTEAVLSNLKTDQYYSIQVVSVNDYGTSIPSLVTVVRTDSTGNSTTKISGTLSPPHSLEVLGITSESISIRWLPPLHILPDAELTYIVYCKPANESGRLDSSHLTISTYLNMATLNGLSTDTEYAVAVKAMSDSKESLLSEVLLVWTNPAVPAFVNPPVIIPEGDIIEGSNITILCIGMGMPGPTISVYVNGELKVKEQQRHVAYTIRHIQRNVTSAACFAENGYGNGAQSFTEIRVSFSPSVRAINPTVEAANGSEVRLECQVHGFPEPRMLWYYGTAQQLQQQQQPIARSSGVDIQSKPLQDNESTYLSILVFSSTNWSHAGKYRCFAENQRGAASDTVSLKVTAGPQRNATACCIERVVSDDCMDACAFDVDIQMALNKPQCLKDLNKLMYCAADGSDHRRCCRQRGVPRSCLKWCVGRPVSNSPICALSSVTDIVACFEEGRAILPGPPQNVHIKQMSSRTLNVDWEPPKKNPEVVQYYHVLWRPKGSMVAFRNQSRTSPVQLTGLHPGLTYEVAVRAGNHYGMSVHTSPLVFTITAQEFTTSASKGAEMSSGIKVLIGLIVTALLVVLGSAIALYVWKKHHPQSLRGVSFENPTFMKDTVNMQNGSNGTSERPVGTQSSSGSLDGVHKIEHPQVANRNFYEEMKGTQRV